jgi:adenylosuccinate lyase
MENILMAAVKKGGNRQLLHETLRRLAFQKPSLTWKTFIEKIAADPAFHLSLQELEKIGAVENLTGRAAEQARAFVEEEVIPSLSSPDKEPSFPPVER